MKLTMTYENQTQKDQHGAYRSGVQREKLLKETFKQLDLTLVKTALDVAHYFNLELTKSGRVKGSDVDFCRSFLDGTVHHDAFGDYKEAGFKEFLSDGYCPQLDAVVELKGGDKSGTTEEKVFFDLMKLEDGCYGDHTLFYIFEGKKEEDKTTKLFETRLRQKQEKGLIRKNVYVIRHSEMTKELLTDLAS